MAISKGDVVSLMNEFHNTVMFKKGTAEDQARFFLHPEPRILSLTARTSHFRPTMKFTRS